MKRVVVEHLKTGDRIGRDIFGAGEAALLRAGTRMSDSYREALRRAEIASVWVDDGLSEGIEPLDVLTESTRRHAAAAMRNAIEHASESLARGDRFDGDIIDDMAHVVEMICGDVAGSANAALALSDLANADGYTLKHSLNVAALGLALGYRVMRRDGWRDEAGSRRFDGIEERLTPLGVGLLLHDIGKLAVPAGIVHKHGPLDPDEWLAMRAHPSLGARMLGADRISPLARAVVRSHHERWDGTGYPSGARGEQIHQFARIAAVADVFDALTSDRCYRRGVPAHEAYRYVSVRSGRDFDPMIVDVFRDFVAPYPPGTSVVLSDGRQGIVTTVRPGGVERPVVRLTADAGGSPLHQDVDLALVPDVFIASTSLDLAPVAPLAHSLMTNRLDTRLRNDSASSL